MANPGPHGFSEILYEFTSAAANNGSGFEGLADNNPPWNIATGIVLLMGRFPALIFPLAVAGFLSAKNACPQHAPAPLRRRSRCSWDVLPASSCRPVARTCPSSRPFPR